MAKDKNELFRYTNLSNLVNMLCRKELILLNPNNWEDRNDSFYIEKCREYLGLKSILALCFTAKKEAFHHWKIYAGNSSGVCIKFKKNELLKNFKNVQGIEYNWVNYKWAQTLKKQPPRKENLAFIKRTAYRDEQEFRIIYKDDKSELFSKGFKIDLSCIGQIILSPWMANTVFESVKKTIQNIDGCSNINISMPDFIDSQGWKDLIISRY